MAMKPRAMGKKKMMRGGAVKKPAAKMMRGGGAVKKPAAKMMRGGITALPGGLPKRGNTEAFESRTELNKKAQAARAAGPTVNAATAKKRADAAAALKRRRANAAAALKRRRANAAAALKRKRTNATAALERKRTNAKKPVAKKPVVKKPSKSDPKREVAYGSSFIDDSGMYKPKRRVSPSSKAIGAIGSAIKGAASGSAKMMRGGMKKPVAKMRGGGMKKK